MQADEGDDELLEHIAVMFVISLFPCPHREAFISLDVSVESALKSHTKSHLLYAGFYQRGLAVQHSTNDNQVIRDSSDRFKDSLDVTLKISIVISYNNNNNNNIIIIIIIIIR